MSKYKVGDKFILEIGEVYGAKMPLGAETDSPVRLYKAKGFNSLVFDEAGLDKLEKYNEVKEKLELIDELKQAEYNKGLQDAWELARRLYLPVDEGGISTYHASVIFGCRYVDVLITHTPQEALAKLEAYEKEQNIKVGDVVSSNGLESVVVRVTADKIYTVTSFGTTPSYSSDYMKRLRRTGKHLDIASILAEIGKE